MTNENDATPEETKTPAAEAAEETKATPAEEAKPAEEKTEETKVEPTPEQLMAAKLELALRALAERENQLKRQEKETQERIARSNETFVKALAPVLNELDLILAQVKETPETKALVEGFRMLAGKFTKTLESVGVKVLAPEAGAPMDYVAYEVLTAMPHPTVAEGCVVSVASKGYQLGPKVVYPAKVIASLGNPEAPAEAPAAEASAEKEVEA